MLQRRSAPLAALTLATFLAGLVSPRPVRAQDARRLPAAEEIASSDAPEASTPASTDDLQQTRIEAAAAARQEAAQSSFGPQVSQEIDKGPRSLASGVDLAGGDQSDALNPAAVIGSTWGPAQLSALPVGPDKSGVTSKSISVPAGGGTIEGMGESFSAQLSTGIATFSVPFVLPAARGMQVSLSLGYSSSAGSGIAGMGWGVGVPFIARQTDRGLPRYDDRESWHPEQDRFVFNGGQELVPICLVSAAGGCTGALPGEVMPTWSAGWQYFRARVEGAFLRFFWSPDHLTWRVQDKSGVTMELGKALDGSSTLDAIERNLDVPAELYRWFLVRQYDAHLAGDGAPLNVVVYRYLQDGGMAYLSDIFDTTPSDAPTTTDVSRYAHHTRLTYEQRSDPTSSYRSGWKIEQRLRLAAVEVASKTFGGASTDVRRLLRRYELQYDPDSHVSLLSSVQVEGRCSGAEANAPAEGAASSSSCERLPAMTFGYSRVEPFTTRGTPGTSRLPGYEGFDERLRHFESSPRHSVEELAADLFDIDSDALPDVLVTSPGTYGGNHGVFFNSPAGRADSFSAVERMGIAGVLGATSSTIVLSNFNVAALDLDGDATVDLLHMPKVKTYAAYTPQRQSGAWTWVGRAIASATDQNPKIDFGNDTPEIELVDVDFDGLVDVVISVGNELQTFFSLGRYPGGDGQFGSATLTSANEARISTDPVTTCLPWAGTPIRFSDDDTHFADMNGDGIADIVRVQRGSIRYWPGRGNGFWGTGRRSDCAAKTFGVDRHVSMAASPQYSDIQGTTLRLDDVNGDGLTDLVQVRYSDVDIWLNVDGVSWTDRHVIEGTPASPSFSHSVRLADINGSGTRDIVWGNRSDYKYIDLQGGSRPWLLTRVANGLGKTTDIDYASSPSEMVEKASTAEPWARAMPIVTHVVKRITESDNLDQSGGRPATVYVTEYDYWDPVFDGRQREFRGFERARATRVGDANSPTDITESRFLSGQCQDENPTDDVDACAVSERWRDNPREALKGLPVVTERLDERGVYLSTDHKTYRLRQLYAGLDGRAVRHAFEQQASTYLYDTAGFVPQSSLVDAVDVIIDAVPVAPEVSACSEPRPSGGSPDLSRQLRLRSASGRVQVRSSSLVDLFGNRVAAVAEGCVAGCTEPDEAITSVTLPERPEGDPTGWLWRTRHGWIKGDDHTECRNQTSLVYNVAGDLLETHAVLSGTLQLDRTAKDGQPGNQVNQGLPAFSSADSTIVVAKNTYDLFGNLQREQQPATGRCRDVGYDDAYEQLPTVETIFAGPVTPNGCGDQPLTTGAAYDRGLGLITVAVDLNGQATYVDHDQFGRVIELRRPPPAGWGSTEKSAVPPSFKLSYTLGNPVSVVHTQTQDGASHLDEQYLEVKMYIDGFGRTLATLQESEVAGRWIVSGLVTFDAKGAVGRKYLEYFHEGSGSPLVLPEAPHGNQRYDAFGRQVQTFDLDGTVTLQSVYHALSTDLFDAADLEPGPHHNTPASERKDGHGRTVDVTERIHQGGVVEERHVLTEYLPTGEPEVITRRRGAAEVVRWLRYDSLGRMVLNVEPNTTKDFNPDPSTNPATLRAWRYAYNDAGDLVGTSDARGCGQNFHYDAAGRITAENYWPCLPEHADYSTGAEITYAYDAATANPGAGIEPPPADGSGSGDPNYSAGFAIGRLVGVLDRASSSWMSYDARGRGALSAVRVARPDPPASGFSGRYAARWYYRSFVFDAADRELHATTGAKLAELRSNAVSAVPVSAYNESTVSTSYSTRGTVQSVSGSYGVLLGQIDRAADGLIDKIVYGDLAATSSDFSYDTRRRLHSVQTYRGPPSEWSSGATYSPLPLFSSGEISTFQLLLQDEDYAYDVVNNPTEIRDWRIPEEWPDGAKPVSRKIQYDDLYRVTRADYQYAAGDDTWVSPFDAENASENPDPRRAQPSPHVSFDKRLLWQRYDYDWLGNTKLTRDDAEGFYDRSLGTVTNAASKPYQLTSATNTSTGSTRSGNLQAQYDDAGSLTRLALVRNGPCLAPQCSQRFAYDWDEVGRLVRARRWDLPAAQVGQDPVGAAAVDLRYAYDASDQRVLKAATSGSEVRHTAYIFDSLELRRAAWNGTDYERSAFTEVGYLSANGARLARLVYDTASIPSFPGSQLHVFLELPDHLGSTSIVIDKATGELVERSTFQPYGGAESDYRPERWKAFREDYRFTGKEEDVEVGLTYFGKRFLNPLLGRWVSADPLGVHLPGEADLNLYAYVHARLLRSIDPLGLCEEGAGGACSNNSTTGGTDSQSGQSQAEVDAQIKRGEEAQRAREKYLQEVGFERYTAEQAEGFKRGFWNAQEQNAQEEHARFGFFYEAQIIAVENNPAAREGADAGALAFRLLGLVTPGGKDKAGVVVSMGKQSGRAKAIAKEVEKAGGGTKAARELPAGIKIPAGNAKAGMEHILRRHAFNTVTTKPASKFAQGMGHIEIRGLVNEATRGSAAWRVEGASRVLDVNMGRVIGTDLAGNATSGLRVVTDTVGSVITAYPIPIP